MTSFTCKCGKVTIDTKQHIITTDCCGIGYSHKSMAAVSQRSVGKLGAGAGKFLKEKQMETGVIKQNQS